MWRLAVLGVLAAATTARAECIDYAADPGALVSLEPYATKGALDDGQKQCLEAGYSAADTQTTKDKISRVLMVNAYAYNTKIWAELVARHLDEVDRSDPDIAYLYAFYLYNNDKADAEEVVRWTEVALERRDTWTGDVYVSRVYGLMRLRAVAANAVWELTEKERAESGSSPEVLDRIEKQRNRVKTFSREWVDFAKVSGRSVKEPLALCLSAANLAKACGVEED
ncbi:MAG: hypothetical protein KC656_24885 [Myxococcales bacterium]|nr:hypothetical protein [Myxococcales bacterium]